jgi:hypothetical protein
MKDRERTVVCFLVLAILALALVVLFSPRASAQEGEIFPCPPLPIGGAATWTAGGTCCRQGGIIVDCDPIPTPTVPVFASPLESPLQAQAATFPIVEIIDVETAPTSGEVNGVWVPVYGLPCDQVWSDADGTCMCFYGAPQWCP